MIRDSSAISHSHNEATGFNCNKKQMIINCLQKKAGWCTRLMLAEELNLPTATISGLVRPLIDSKDLEESEDKMPCQLSGRRVYWLRLNKQGELF